MNSSRHWNLIYQQAGRSIAASWRVALLLLLALPVTLPAQFNYEITDGKATITGYTGPGGLVTIPNTLDGCPVTIIGNNAFSGLANVTSVSIPDNVTSIGDFAFEGCSGLTNMTIENNVTSIGYCAFESCSSLTSLKIGPSVTSIGDFAFHLCSSLTSLTIGPSVTSIGDSAFWGCSRLTNVIIPASVTSIGVEAFTACYSLSWIRVDTNNPAYSSVDGVLFDKSETKLFQYPVASAATSYTIPNSVTNIGVGAFSNCSGLASVTIGPSVTSIGDFAFAECSGLTSVSIGNSVTSIGVFAFQWCTSLTSLTIGTSVTNIGYHAFEYCTSLTSLIIPASVTSIADGAFEECSSLSWIRVDTNNPAYSSVDGVLFNKSETTLFQYPIASAATSYTIPNSVTSIGYDAFEGCSRLANMTIENNVTSIGDSAFARCPLASVTIGPSVTNIGDYAFSFTSLTNLTIGNGVTSIGDYAFEECRSLTNVTIGSGVTTIGVMAFFDCSSLSSVWMGSSVTSIGGSAFIMCASLMGLYCYGNAPNLDVSPFSGDNNATVYYLPGTTGWGTTFGGRPTALWPPPAIQRSPLTQTAEAGLAVGLGVEASSLLPLFYLWYFNASNFITCSTNSELELASVQLSQSGAYTVVISNVLGAITSAPALLEVIAPVERRAGPGRQGNGRSRQFGEPGIRRLLQPRAELDRARFRQPGRHVGVLLRSDPAAPAGAVLPGVADGNAGRETVSGPALGSSDHGDGQHWRLSAGGCHQPIWPDRRLVHVGHCDAYKHDAVLLRYVCVAATAKALPACRITINGSVREIVILSAGLFIPAASDSQGHLSPPPARGGCKTSRSPGWHSWSSHWWVLAKQGFKSGLFEVDVVSQGAESGPCRRNGPSPRPYGKPYPPRLGEARGKGLAESWLPSPCPPVKSRRGAESFAVKVIQNFLSEANSMRHQSHPKAC